MKRMWAIFIVVGLVLTNSALARAHGRSTSYITWILHDSLATARVKMALLDHNALLATWASAKPPRNAHDALPEAISIADESGPCKVVPGSFHELAAEHGSVSFEWQARCTNSDGSPFVATKMRSDLLFDVAAAHVALVRFHDSEASLEADYVLTESQREVVLPKRTQARSANALSTVVRFSRAGFEHLLTGWDHLAFLLALVLASRSRRMAIVSLTGFTLGHSLTLSLAVLGHAATKTATVESLIAISIMVVSIENIWMAEDRAGLRLPLVCMGGLFLLTLAGSVLGAVSPMALVGLSLFEACYLGLLGRAAHPEDLRWACAGLFGLLHGFGFAGMLSQMDLSPGNRALPLASFNIGIEVAQVAAVCLAWPLLAFLKRRHSEKFVMGWGSAATLAMGTYGCLTRLFV